MTANSKTVKTLSPVMAKNNALADENRAFLNAHGIVCANIMSSPGSGKTTLLESMARVLGASMRVIEGDVQTRRDAERIERAGCRAHQIETRGACHLDAEAIGQAMQALELSDGGCRVLIIENVGNLICPSSYQLGEHLRVAVLSLPEGDDKVLKYPSMFSRVDALIINKIDLLPHLDFDVERAVMECRSLSPKISVFKTSAKTGDGVRDFCDYLIQYTSTTRNP